MAATRLSPESGPANFQPWHARVLLEIATEDNLASMQRPRTQKSQHASLIARLGAACVVAGACATAGPVIPDTTEKVQPPSSREGANANDVFMRKPWEIWHVPGGTARYHRGAFLLLPDESQSFAAADVSVYAADGSDVRVDYASVGLGAHSQSRESISIFVYRASASLDGEWISVVDRVRRQHAGAQPADPFPLPDKHPPETKQMALVASSPSGDSSGDTYVQVSLFHQGEWAVRYEITCPATDVEAARDMTRSFLRSIRARE
jgi:hypothetical protein